MPPEAAAIDAAPAAPDIPQSATIEAPFNDAFAELDRIISDEPDETAPETKPDETQGKPDAQDKKASASEKKTQPNDKNKKGMEASKDKREDAPEDKKGGDDKAKGGSGTDAAPDTGKSARKTPWQLVHQYEAEISTLKKDLETARGGSPKDHPEFKALQERAEAAQKRADELENRIRFVSYKDSQEFKDKYEKPYVDAWITGRQRVAGMTVITDPETGESRKGTPEDFDTLMKIVSDDAAAEFAAEHFGNRASSVMYHREKVQELSGQADRAVEEYRTKGSEQEKQAREQAETFNKTVSTEVGKLWNEGINGASEKYPQWSKPVEGDEKGNQLLARGLEMANKAFASFNVFDPKLSKEQRSEMVRLHTALFNKAAWFDRLAYQKQAVDKENAELKKQLEEFKASAPGAGSGRRGKTDEAALNGWEAELDKLAT